VTAVVAPAPSDPLSFAPLVRVVTDHGLLLRRRRRYALTIAGDLGLLALTGAAMVALGSSWWQLALAVPAAAAVTRIAFIGHDAGHKQLARTARANRIIGLVAGNLIVGMSYGWWVSKHSRHHAHPNDVTRDPDVGNGVLAWTPEQAVGRTGFAGWLVRHQALMFFPLLTLEAVHLKVSSWRSLRSPGRSPVEAALLAANLAGYLAFVFTVMGPAQAVAFVALHHALIGLHLGCAFAPNHKGMPMPAPGQRWTHLQRQVITSRNVRGGPVTDWLLGGLNYQIEHHLFPGMPRPSLRAAQLFVRAHCHQVGLPYTEEPALTSYRQALRHLATAATP
jgi:fatty acid desaturase